MKRIKLSNESEVINSISKELSMSHERRTEFVKDPKSYISTKGINLKTDSLSYPQIFETSETVTIYWNYSLIYTAAATIYYGAVIYGGKFVTIAAYGLNLITDPSFHNGAGAIGGHLV